MRVTTKGQVTIPQRFRLKFGLLPHTDVSFEEADGGVTIRPLVDKRALVADRLRKARGVAVRGLRTEDIVGLTRGDD
jgi:AbrB family looped-hinge helix DNA binding protein